MKVTSWTKKLAGTLVAGAMILPSAASAAMLDVNLLVDPGFEDVNSTTGAYGALQLNSWQDGTKIGFTYASGQYDNGGPLAGGGQRYFTANQTSSGDAEGPGEISQLVDVSTGDTATAIAAGTATYSLSAFFTTYDVDNDFGFLHVDFLDAASSSLGTDEIGPGVNEGTWTLHSGGGMVPVGTASILVSVYGDGTNSGHDGYVDNASLSIGVIPEPTSILLAGLGLAGAGVIRLRRRNG